MGQKGLEIKNLVSIILFMKFKSELLNELDERGVIKDIINPDLLDQKLMAGEKICVYGGFDCTADSLHAGHILPIKTLSMFHKFGHRVIVLFGGATTRIGDPSGRDESRKMQTEADINSNKIGIMKSISKFINQDENLIFVDNLDWIGRFSYIEFLRDVGVHFSVNKMLTMDSVKTRLENNGHMSFLEFSYMLLQGYDFYHLNREYGCNMQIGGSEQWGNIVQGIDLIGRKCEKKPDLFGLTLNLITRSDGKKMGKSESGAVWINEDKMSEFDFYQYFRNTADADVEKFLLLFTDFPIDEVKKISEMEINEQKKILSHEITKITHGIDSADSARNRAVMEFENRVATQDLSFEISGNYDIVSILLYLELFQSRGECKKMIQNGGVSIDGEKIAESWQIKKGKFLLKIGKKRIYNLLLV